MIGIIKDALTLNPPEELADIYLDWYSPYYNLFYLLSGPGKIAVELGVDQGRGSASFALGGCEVYGIDHTRKIGIDKLDRFPNFTFIEKDSIPVPEILADKKIDFLHIDTEHSYSMAKAEWEAYQPYLNPGAIVFFDDTHAQNDGVLKFFLTLNHPKYMDDRLHPSCGFGFIIYE